MNELVLTEWQCSPVKYASEPVIPDGCRDLIMRLSPGRKPEWHISSLEECTYVVPIQAGVCIHGFRLQPGVQIREEKLLASIEDWPVETGEVQNRLADFVSLSPSVSEALESLAFGFATVAHAAKGLGVSQRTLQRLLVRQTGRSPIFWLQLARVRKAARSTSQAQSLVATADLYGYADQAHMCREFKRWLGVTPAKISAELDIQKQLLQTGYA